MRGVVVLRDEQVVLCGSMVISSGNLSMVDGGMGNEYESRILQECKFCVVRSMSIIEVRVYAAYELSILNDTAQSLVRCDVHKKRRYLPQSQVSWNPNLPCTAKTTSSKIKRTGGHHRIA